MPVPTVMPLLRILVVLTVVATTKSTERVDFTEAQLLRLHEVTVEKMREIRALESEGDLEVMGERSDSCDILLLNHSASVVKEELDSMHLDYEVIVKDVQAAIVKEQKSSVANVNSSCLNGRSLLRSMRSCFGWESYYRLADIYKYLDHLQESFSQFITVETIGISSEQRPIKLVKISSRTNDTKPKAIWVDGGTHAREWISPSAAIYIAYQVAISFNSNDSTFSGLDLYILPVMNPDGYEYSHTTNRFWRKNRSPNKRSHCVGTDLNRNWDYHWGGKESNWDPCSANYRGSKAFSESETASVSSYILGLNNSSEIMAYLSLHSYGQSILFPWAYTYSRPSDFNHLYDLAYSMSNGVEVSNGVSYSIGTAAELYYIASGGAQDWAKGAAKIKYAYTMELRDTGLFGFSLPAKKILETSKDAFAAFTALTKKMNS